MGATNDELVSAQSHDLVVPARALAQRSRARHDHRVAGLVPELVVDRLEPVEIEEQQRDALAVAVRAGELLIERALQPAPVAETRQRFRLGLFAQRVRGRDPVERAGEVLHHRLHRRRLGARLVDRSDQRGEPARGADVERDVVDPVAPAVVVPVAGAEPQRWTDGDVVDRQLGTDDARERREGERQLLQAFDDVAVGQLRGHPGGGRRRRVASQELRVDDAREADADLQRDLAEELFRWSEVGLGPADDDHTEDRAVADQWVVGATVGFGSGVDLDRRVPGDRHRRADTVHGVHLRDHVDRVLQIAGGIDARGIDLRELEQARGFEQLDQQCPIRTGIAQPFQTAGLERVEPGEGGGALAHVSTPSVSAMRSSWSSISRVTGS